MADSAINSVTTVVTSLLPVLIALLTPMVFGAVLGVFFFASLWWTVHRGLQSSSIGLWFFASFATRFSVVLLGIYWVADGQWQRLMACMVGLIVARWLMTVLVTRWTLRLKEKQEKREVADNAA